MSIKRTCAMYKQEPFQSCFVKLYIQFGMISIDKKYNIATIVDDIISLAVPIEVLVLGLNQCNTL